MRTLISFAAILLFSLSTQVAAEKIYRWTDDNGQTHFGSQPPRDIEQQKQAEEYDVKVSQPAAGTEAYRIPLKTDKPEEAAAEEEVLTTKSSLTREEAEAGCKKARDYKRLVTTNYSRRFKQEDGVYRPLTDEQRAAEIKKADEMIDYYCNQQFSNKSR
ncbi:MAG: DUF4124 domain-containing protein [Pseudomonadota bacterium]|nr:DUF4124 domain-containing protein [Pseudomonadota bacterium]